MVGFVRSLPIFSPTQTEQPILFLSSSLPFCAPSFRST